MQDESVLVARLESVPEYRARFRDVFDGLPTKQRIAFAFDAYVRKLTTPNSGEVGPGGRPGSPTGTVEKTETGTVGKGSTRGSR